MDPYSVLGLAPDAGERELTAAYRELAKRWHPDRGGGEEAARRMAQINAAYELLRADAENGRPPKPPRRRRAATLSVRTTAGRRLSFAALQPHTAATIERHLREAAIS